MRSNRLAAFIAFSFTVVLIFASMFLMSFFKLNKWVGVSVGGGMFVVSAVLFLLLRKSRKRLAELGAITVNAIGSGIAVSSLFVYLEGFPPVWQIVAASVAAIALFFGYVQLTRLGFMQKHPVIMLSIILAVILALEILGAIYITGGAFYYGLILIIPFGAFSFALIAKSNTQEEFVTHLAYASFTALILVIFAVLVVLSEGEALDVGGGGGPDSKKKKKP